MTPAARTAAGYRLYDERALERLAFIAHAKQLGCTLEEITDLVVIWDGDECAPVQRRFHELVTAKLAETEQRIAALKAFSDQLQVADARLAEPPVDGPCDERRTTTSACASALTTEGPVLVTAPARQPGDGGNDS